MTFLTVVSFLGGLTFLILGAEWLVRGASRLAAKIGISPLVIGLTVVAFGTSAPEMAVSVQSSLAGQPDIAIGNVVGSNIFNILLILGISAVITPLVVQQQLIWLDVPLMIGVSFLVYFMSLDGAIGRLEAGLLFLGIIIYTAFLIIQSRKEKNKEVEQEYEQEYAEKDGKETGWKPWAINLGLVVAGLGFLVYGSNLLVDSAVSFARWLGLSELIIGLTIVAAGTSMPEVAASIAAAIKGERDIAIGNVIGSNIFNLLSVLGLSGLVSPVGLPVSSSAIAFDMPVMLAVAVAILPILFVGHRIARWEGWVFLTYYVAYTAYLILDASQHDALPLFSGVMLWFVVPFTLLTIVVSLLLDLRKPRKTA